MKKLLAILLCSTFILGIATGCGKDEEKDTKKPEVQEKSKGKCEVAECMKELKPEMKVEEINEIIGFEGEKEEDKENYIWQLTEKTKIEVEYTNGKGRIDATYNKEDLKNEDVKISICYDIVNNIKEKTYTYEEMVEKLEGVEGNLESYSSTSKMYSWVNKDGQTFRATFSESLKGKASIVSIR